MLDPTWSSPLLPITAAKAKLRNLPRQQQIQTSPPKLRERLVKMHRILPQTIHSAGVMQMQSLQIKMRGEQKLLLGRPSSTRHQQVEEGDGEGGMDKGKVEGALGKREAGGRIHH